MHERIAIIGLGLIGSSIGLQLYNQGSLRRIMGVDTDSKTCTKALALYANKVSDRISDIPSDTDVVIIASPIHTMRNVITQLDQHLDDNTLITDVSSVKHGLIKELQNTSENFRKRFVPAHPIAGSEQSGIDGVADAKLFDKKRIIMTPTHHNTEYTKNGVHGFWALLSQNISTMTPTEHDVIYAHVSHVPQLLSYALGSAMFHVLGAPLDKEQALFVKKHLRIAASPPALWAGIFEANREVIDPLVRVLQSLLRPLCNKYQTPSEHVPNGEDAIISLISMASQLHLLTDKYEQYAGSGLRDIYQTPRYQFSREVTSSSIMLECFSFLSQYLKQNSNERYTFLQKAQRDFMELTVAATEMEAQTVAAT